MRWLKFTAAGQTSWGIVEGNNVISVSGDPFGEWQRTAQSHALNDVKIELPVDAHLPHEYIPGERLRLEAYRKIAEVAGEDALAAIRAELLAGIEVGAEKVGAEEAGAGKVGAKKVGAECVEIGDRGAAIAEAVRRAEPGDTVLVAGKGHEQGQTIDGVTHPFDDAQVARELLEAVAR